MVFSGNNPTGDPYSKFEMLIASCYVKFVIEHTAQEALSLTSLFELKYTNCGTLAKYIHQFQSKRNYS